MTTLDQTYSWVIVRTATNEPIIETYNEAILSKLNRAKYHALPINDWLAGLSKTEDGLLQKRIVKGYK
jgi:hypothetical protein